MMNGLSQGWSDISSEGLKYLTICIFLKDLFGSFCVTCWLTVGNLPTPGYQMK